ncbi:MAG: pyridoxamine 5'-phosphate oxidase family protein [Candidatus Bathyarchaeota archaeon]|nr:pyridoxamine 5'-phosphate oxidase family protein [Candidatus Bathyarchaeota archaeon]
MSSEPQGYLSGKPLADSDLKERIAAFLQSTNMCVLATCSGNVPRATPLEYRSKGLTIYFVGEPGIKLKNIKENPRVSIGVFLPYKGWNSAKGAQITGLVKIISREESFEFSEGLEAYNWEETAKELGIEEFPQTVVLVKVTPVKIEFIDATLKQAGYSARQVLTL